MRAMCVDGVVCSRSVSIREYFGDRHAGVGWIVRFISILVKPYQAQSIIELDDGGKKMRGILQD